MFIVYSCYFDLNAAIFSPRIQVIQLMKFIEKVSQDMFISYENREVDFKLTYLCKNFSSP